MADRRSKAQIMVVVRHNFTASSFITDYLLRGHVWSSHQVATSAAIITPAKHKRLLLLLLDAVLLALVIRVEIQ